MYNFKLTKNEEKVAQFVILEAITENYWDIKFNSQKIWTDLLLEFAMYDEKSQNKLTIKYRNLLERKYNKIIPEEGNFIKISRLDDKNFYIKTDTEEYILKIFLENKYLIIEKKIKESK